MSDKNLNLLLLEDVEYDAINLMEFLKSAGFDCNFDWVSEKDPFIEKLKYGNYDIILSDYRLPGFSGVEALKISRQLLPDVPFICVSGTIGEEMAVDLIHLGASDYVIKDRLSKLPVSIEKALNEAREKATRLEAETKLMQSEERLRDIIMSSYDWIWETDTKWRYTYVSEQVEKIIGYHPDEVMGKTPIDFMPEEERYKFHEILRLCIQENIVINDLENRCLHKNGAEVWLLTNGFPVFNADGYLVGYRGIDKDITEQKRLTTELIEAKEKAELSDRLKTAFMNNISHEIRTPLSVILGFADILFQPGLELEEREAYLKILHENSDRLLDTITNYMDISLLMSGNIKAKRTPVDMQKLLENAKEKFLPRCNEKNLTLNIENADRGKLSYYGDQELLERAVFHLIDNAVKFTVTGSVTLGVRHNDNSLEFFIRDTGPGIDIDAQNRIFNVFIQGENTLTRNYEGNGLGLSIAKAIAELMGGTINVNSEVGKGTVFSLELYRNNELFSADQSSLNNHTNGRVEASVVVTPVEGRARRVLNY